MWCSHLAVQAGARLVSQPPMPEGSVQLFSVGDTYLLHLYLTAIELNRSVLSGNQPHSAEAGRRLARGGQASDWPDKQSDDTLDDRPT
jgi:hypothetical protein